MSLPVPAPAPGTPTPLRRVGETDALFPHIEVPFTAADREAILQTRDMLCQFQMLLENFGNN